MKHLRSDYDRIQDPAHKIKEDEPVFLLRGQDKNFVPMLKAYCAMLRQDQDIEHAVFIEDQIAAIEEWQQKNGTKTPDLDAASKPSFGQKELPV